MAQTLDFDPPHTRSSLYRVQSSVVQPLCLLPVCCLLSVWEQSSASLRMTRWALVAPLLLLLSVAFDHRAVGQASEEPAAAPGQASDGAPAEDDTDEWGLNSLRGGLESVGGYFDSVLELMGGRDGVCQHRCRYGRPLLARKLPSLDCSASNVVKSSEK